MSKPAKCLYFAAVVVQFCMIKDCTGQEPETEELRLHNLEESNGVSIEEIKAALYKSEVIPDVIDTTPMQMIKVGFGNEIVKLGNKLKPLDIMVPPSYVSWEYEKYAKYILILSGPDYPNRFKPDMREYPHWVVGNIPGNSIWAGETVFEYKDPPSTYDVGTHRFVFTLFKQNGSEALEFDEAIIMRRNMTLFRKYFSTDAYGRKYRCGPPVGVNFFEVDL